MPELPEVETVVRTLRPLVIGRRITNVWVGEPERGKALRILSVSPEEFSREITGARIRSVSRFGKTILLSLAIGEELSEKYLAIHLGMTGRLTCEDTDMPASRHTHIVLALDGPQSWVHYTDVRRFGKLRVSRSLPENLRALGPDPLEITESEFYSSIHSRKTTIKSLLLDQRFLRGVGNIYADESLFRARLRPAAIAARITRRRAAELLQSIRETLEEAIFLRGSSVSDYVDAEGNKGTFQSRHQVYRRTGKPCFLCGKPIQKMTIAGRSTHYCSHCQKR